MNRLEILKNEKQQILNEIKEKDINLYATKQRIVDYEKALEIKSPINWLECLFNNSLFTIEFIGILHFILEFIVLIKFFEISSSIQSIADFWTINSTLLCGGLLGVLETKVDYDNALKKYKQNGSKYSYLTKEELEEKIKQLYETKKSLESELEKLKPILNYLKEAVEKEEEKFKIKEIQFVRIEDLKKDYKDSHLKEYDIPKVKMKRRNENDTKAKRHI